MPRALDGATYTDPQRWIAQRDRILARGWHVLADRFDLGDANAFPTVFLEGSVHEPILIAHDEDRTRALSNVCTHRGALLVDEACSLRTIRCPYHGRRFRLDGSIAAAPGFDAIDENERLPEISLASLGPLFFASLAPPIDFENAIAPMQKYLGFFAWSDLKRDDRASARYEIDAHWLLWCENYLEGFHIPYVHPRLARALDLDRYEIETEGLCSLQIGEAAPGEPQFDLPPDHPHAGRRIGGYYLFVYPTTALNFYPWGVSMNLVRPIGGARTRIEYRVYVAPHAERDRGAGANLNQLEEEDDAIVLRAQRGVGSRLYRPGNLSDAHERGVAWLHRLLAADLDGR